MVEPLEVELLESEPGELYAENIKVVYRITSVKAAKVGNGISIVVDIDVSARGPPERGALGLCSAGVSFVLARFRTEKIAKALARVGEVEVEIYVEPIALGIAPGYINTVGEPCVTLQTVTGWSVRQR